jgi:hypothetical protein
LIAKSRGVNRATMTPITRRRFGQRFGFGSGAVRATDLPHRGQEQSESLIKHPQLGQERIRDIVGDHARRGQTKLASRCSRSCVMIPLNRPGCR